MHREDMLQTLDLQDQNVLDYEVEAITAIQFDVFVLDGKGNLSFDIDCAEMKLVAKAFFVSRFEKSRPEGSMNLDRGTDHALSKFFVKKFAP